MRYSSSVTTSIPTPASSSVSVGNSASICRLAADPKAVLKSVAILATTSDQMTPHSTSRLSPTISPPAWSSHRHRLETMRVPLNTSSQLPPLTERRHTRRGPHPSLSYAVVPRLCPVRAFSAQSTQLGLSLPANRTFTPPHLNPVPLRLH